MQVSDFSQQAAPSRRGLLLASGAGAVLALSGARLASAAPSGAYAAADFFAGQRTRAAVLSPTGARIAIMEQLGTRDEPRGVIDLLDAADPEGPRRRIELGELAVEALEWANDRRLLARVVIKQVVPGRKPPGSNMVGPSRTVTSRRIVSLDHETGDPVVLFEGERQRLRYSLDLGRVIDILPDDPDHVLMTAWERDGVMGLHRMNINDGKAERLERGNIATIGWQTHNGVAVLRRDINARGTVETIHARAPGETEWRFVRRNRIVDAPDFSWVGGGGAPNAVLVSARAEGEDVETIREMNLHTLALGAPIQPRADRDVLYGLTDARKRYVGAAYYGDRLEYDFAEEGLAAHHRAMNRFFEDDCDVHLSQISDDRNRFIAYVEGPREPGAWYLYDKAARSMTNLGSRYALDFERLGGCELLSVRTRDGALIEAYLTAPPGAAPGPLVVMPHGGPEARDQRGFDRQVQVLAAQGWWVLQPNFRGSGGYGLAFAQQGWRRWGERMQEDVEDAVAQVVRDKGLDGGRVAIMGTSYGGYAALMGAVRRPDLYKAAISICGVTDLSDMLAWERRDDDTPTKEVYGFWKKRIGDPDTDGAMLEAASPRRRAADIVCPVLLVHGVDDGIVPVIQSRIMNSALRGSRKTVDYVEVPDAGHADWADDVEKELMERYVALLRTAFA
ncbi:alpha/beta hydrolase family protein [Brevundimonas sp. NPDC090276]|uniref:alpha/beta hydrolase family protein n=1 Tax=Brevundimonas sp. NPDC090276 TaxID=3363956 RepID=UPI00383A52E2